MVAPQTTGPPHIAMNLHWTTVPTFALALLLLHTPAAAQEGQDPPPVGETPTGKPAPRTNVPVKIPVKDVEATTASRLLAEVAELHHDLFQCATCKVESRAGGKCCSAERVSLEATKLFERAEIAVDRRSLALTVRPHHWGSLSELDRVLGKFEARVARAEFRLPQNARLSVTGVDGEKSAKRLRSALIDLKVFPSVTVLMQPDGKSAWVIPKIEKVGVTVADVEAALAKLGEEYAIADVQWAAYCPGCRTKSTSEMGTPTCKRR